MPGVRVATVIDAPPDRVWQVLADVADHVDWMEDAARITFTSEQRSGEGTTFDCVTRVGPLRLTDRMEITEWEAPHAMGVRHVGAVAGTGVFTVAPRGHAASLFTWTEELTFPWWLGGRIGALVGRPVLERIWRRNLANLRALVEQRVAER